MGKDELSKAEQYRKERKERLAKEAKKNSKRNAAVAKAKGVMLKVVAIIVAVAVVFGATVLVVNATGSTVFRSKVASIGNHKVSSVEFGYYYRTIYNYYYQYGSQGYDIGFDTSVSPDEQKYTADDNTQKETTTAATDGETTTAAESTTKAKNYDTWHDYISDSTLQQLKNYYILYDEAVKDGMKLSDAQVKGVEKQIEDIRKTATDNGFTLNAYLKLVYGNGINEKLLKKFMLRDELAKKFSEEKQKSMAEEYTDEQVLKEYNDNINDYSFVDYRSQTFTVSDTQDAAATKKLADEFLAKADSEENFENAADEILIADKIKSEKESNSDDKSATVDEAAIKKEYTDNSDNTLKKKSDFSTVSGTSTELAKWLFNSSRKAGDKTVVEVKTNDEVTSYIAVYTVTPIYKEEEVGVNVRHILFKFTEDSSSTEEPTDEQKKAAKTKAEDALKQWKSGDMTEDSFAALATELSEDTGSSSNGGLYENVTQGQMVQTFNDWIFDSSRKTGDTDIVETEYGYHVMYFVGKSNRQVWDNTIRDNLSKKDFENYSKKLTESSEYDIEEKPFSYNVAKKHVIKDVKRYIFNSSKSNSNNSNGITVS